MAWFQYPPFWEYHIHEAAGGTHMLKATGNIQTNETAGSTRMYKDTCSIHTNETASSTHMYKGTCSIHTNEAVGSTHMYKATGSFHTNETSGSTRMYKGRTFLCIRPLFVRFSEIILKHSGDEIFINFEGCRCINRVGQLYWRRQPLYRRKPSI